MARFSTGTVEDAGTSLQAVLFALHGDRLILLECGSVIFGEGPPVRAIMDKEPCPVFFNSLRFTK
jgi:hypothetical protein